MKKFDYIEAAKKIFEIESRVVSELSNQLDDNFNFIFIGVSICIEKLIIFF